MKGSRRGWTVILCLSVYVVMVIQGRATSPADFDGYASQPAASHRYDETDEYDKYIMENELPTKGELNKDIRDMVDLFEELSNGVGDVDRNAYQNGVYNYRPPLPGPGRFPPPTSSSVDKMNHMSERIMNTLYHSFGGPTIRSMIEQYSRYSYTGAALVRDDGECCKYDAYTIIPGFVLVATSYLLLILLNATVTGGKRRRRDVKDNEDNNVMLDGPTWLSMVHELWEQDDSPESIACVQETLCRMNHLAMAAPGQAGWALSLSSLPLSYLLHARHTGGFASYIDAALMGRSGANCTELYSSCPRLRY